MFTHALALYLLTAALWTIGLSLFALLGGGVLGFCIALMRVSNNRIAATISGAYIQVVQGIPLLVLLFISYFGFSIAGFNTGPLITVFAAFSIYSAAYLGEIWRGCIESVPKTQWEASACLGFPRHLQLAQVILPQALRISIPPTVGFMVQLVKNTSLASTVGFIELARAGQILNNTTFRPFTIFLLVASIYFCICFPLSYLSRRLEGSLHVANR
jgi:polar amino acid transport system permease protein